MKTTTIGKLNGKRFIAVRFANGHEELFREIRRYSRGVMECVKMDGKSSARITSRDIVTVLP